tara:strand:+ start:356 stop:532 length:177 start_codon:yes stop_codon:yes gene_type:complete
MTYKKDAQKFLNNWRKEQGLEGTRVKPPQDIVPLHLRQYMKMLVKDQKHKLRPEAHDV